MNVDEKVPAAFLTRADLRALGLGRRAVDAVFAAVPVIKLPGYALPLIRLRDFSAFIESCTYDRDRVRPTGGKELTQRVH